MFFTICVSWTMIERTIKHIESTLACILAGRDHDLGSRAQMHVPDHVVNFAL